MRLPDVFRVRPKRRISSFAGHLSSGATGKSHKAGLCGLLLLLVAPVVGSAQVVTGRVLDGESHAPLAAALVFVLDASGDVVRRGLASESGGFRFQLPTAGSYVLRVERLGSTTTTTTKVEVGEDEVANVQIEMAAEPIRLNGIVVGGEDRCRELDNASENTHTVWEQARRNLEAATLTDANSTISYELVSYRRDLDPETLHVLREQERRQFSRSNNPIKSRDAELLADSGFVIEHPSGDRYFAPDASAFLSDAFLSTHCFGLTDGPTPELVGLTFAPLRRSSAADIEGVLYLDRGDSSLRWMEFRYTGLPGVLAELRDPRIGGRIEFELLPGGRWVVSLWYIRMPVAQEIRGGRFGMNRVELVRIAEDGGRVVQARYAGGVAYAEDQGWVDGIVQNGGSFDIRGDSVRLVGTAYATVVEPSGRFRLGPAPAGDYLLAYVRRDLQPLDHAFVVGSVGIQTGARIELDVERPSAAVVLADACDVDTWPAGGGVLEGLVVGSGPQDTLPAPAIRASWTTVRDLDLARTTVDATETLLTTNADHMGRFRFCEVQTGSDVAVAIQRDGRWVEVERVVLAPDAPVAFVRISR